MSKLQDAKDLLEALRTSNRLGQESLAALQFAADNRTEATLTEATRKLAEWQLVRNDLKERLENWETK